MDHRYTKQVLGAIGVVGPPLVLPHNALAVLASTAIRHFHKKRTNEMYYGIRENGWHCAIKQVTHSISHAV